MPMVFLPNMSKENTVNHNMGMGHNTYFCIILAWHPVVAGSAETCWNQSHECHGTGQACRYQPPRITPGFGVWSFSHCHCVGCFTVWDRFNDLEIFGGGLPILPKLPMGKTLITNMTQTDWTYVSICPCASITFSWATPSWRTKDSGPTVSEVSLWRIEPTEYSIKDGWLWSMVDFIQEFASKKVAVWLTQSWWFKQQTKHEGSKGDCTVKWDS